jgi:hypothetical protein
MDMSKKTQVHKLTTETTDLIEHRDHLPEVQWCHCGYVREDTTADEPVLAASAAH